MAEAERKASEAAGAHAQILQEIGEELQARIKVHISVCNPPLRFFELQSREQDLD